MRTAALTVGLCFAVSLIGQNVRVTNDFPAAGYVSAYTIATGTAYTDPVLQECSKARGRQNEPAIAVDPRNTSVLLGSSNDYCGTYAGSPDTGPFVPAGPVWLGYYRSENSGASFVSSLVPGYPGDQSPFAALAKVRTASAGDPVIAWDGHGRAFFGAESSGDPAGTKKSFGDVWVARFDNPNGEGGDAINDGKRYRGTSVVARGSSAPNLLGVFHDKTSIEADRTGGRCDANVYFAWARFTGNGVNAIYFVRSTDHGETWSMPHKLTESVQSVQDPDIAITGNGNVYVTYRTFAFPNGLQNTISAVKSTDCGATFSLPREVVPFTNYAPRDVSDPKPIPIPDKYRDDPDAEAGETVEAGVTRDCGDFSDHCAAGYTFFRASSTPRSTADQYDKTHEWVYIVYGATKPGTEVSSGTTYGSVSTGTGSQSGAYFVRLNGADWSVSTPTLLDDQATGHQIFPDISADGGVLHVVWWDSRRDPAYSPMRPIGNDAAGMTGPSLDAWSAKSTDAGATWTGHTRLSTVSSNPNYEQFDNRTVPFAGDYLWITSLGNFAYATWTDWRNTVAGADPRETASEDNDGADVKQCRTFNTTLNAWTSDTCPHDGGLDQDIYGSIAP